ncbi:MAG: diaminopimelate decarboxylase, partial [Clostridia bacterium]|nr:diaminopimelate decarboxylase [Clostridia bacterium]
VIGGVKASELRAKYGTPLYVMDVAFIKAVCNAFKNTIKNSYDGFGGVAFASKAFSCKAIYTIMKSLDMNIDVVSSGEIYTAISSGFDISKAYFHGNNKLISELEYAVDNRIGVIVIDNIEEIEILDKICKERRVMQRVNIRTNPGVEAHTHSYIQTAKIDSKFGFSIENGDAMQAIEKILACKNLILNGVNCHIGSQIFDSSAFRLAVDVMTDFILAITKRTGYKVPELNMGGGFGVHYTANDPKFTLDDYCRYISIIINAINDAISSKGIHRPRLMIEPGRSIVGEAGITLYSVGNIRDIKGIKKYICIDGGMFDNIRPALYQAEYEAVIATKCNKKAEETVSIAGKCCESGDIIIDKINLPKAERGDIIAVFTTGAYGYSMASNYNRNAIPPVVMVENGVSDYAIKQQTFDDITRNDNIPEFLK